MVSEMFDEDAAEVPEVPATTSLPTNFGDIEQDTITEHKSHDTMLQSEFAIKRASKAMRKRVLEAEHLPVRYTSSAMNILTYVQSLF